MSSNVNLLSPPISVLLVQQHSSLAPCIAFASSSLSSARGWKHVVFSCLHAFIDVLMCTIALIWCLFLEFAKNCGHGTLMEARHCGGVGSYLSCSIFLELTFRLTSSLSMMKSWFTFYIHKVVICIMFFHIDVADHVLYIYLIFCCRQYNCRLQWITCQGST